MNYPIRTKENANRCEFDVQLDWLYKGKRRNKPKALSAQPLPKLPKQKLNDDINNNQNISNSSAIKSHHRSRSKSVSNAMLSESTTTGSNQDWIKVKQDLLKEQSLSPKMSRSRSSSISNNSNNLTAMSLGSTSSSNNSRPLNSSTSNIKRSYSLSEKPKKSIFNALFGKKQQPVNTPQVKTTTNTKPKINTTSKEIADSVETKLDIIRERRSADMKQLSRIPLRRVRFAVDKFDSDPPQQLPSRKPILGNILIPDDMISDIPLISIGINNSKGTSDSSSPKQPSNKYTKDSKEYKIALDHYKKSLKESERRQLDAHVAAENVAKEVKNFKTTPSLSKVTSNQSRNGSFPLEDENDLNSDKSRLNSNIEIDKPININAHPFLNTEETSIENGLPTSREISIDEMTLDVIYTRCCHLREILPIPSTLRQVKGKVAPLHVLKFLNPRPTLIDILSFCDFISIVPIHIVIFDNVALTSEMLRIVLTSLVNSNVLEKLGLRNVVINQQDWLFLCKFLLQNKSIIKLDISQTKTKSDQGLDTYRENMNWTLLSDMLSMRKGRPLEELLLNGIKVSYIPLDEFMELLKVFGNKNHGKNKQRLGIAMTDIGPDHIKNLLNWMSQYKIQGVDLGFNNLSSLIIPIIDKISLLNYDNLEYFTLNSTELNKIEDVAELLNALALLPNIQFLDLSNLPAIFPGILPTLNNTLPKFPNLKRIHLDNNNMDFKHLTLLCNILVKCKTLSHISLISSSPTTTISSPSSIVNIDYSNDKNNENSSHPSEFLKNSLWGQYYSLAHDLPNLVSLNINYENIPGELQSRIALCLMMNMKKTMDSNFQIDELTSQDELLFDGSLLTDTADEVLKKMNTDAKTGDKLSYSELDASRQYILKKYIEKLNNVLKKVEVTIDLMLEKSKNDQLPMQEKENLLRLLLLKRNLFNILEILSNAPKLSHLVSPLVSQPVSSFDLTDSVTETMSSTAPRRPELNHVDSSRLLSQAVGTIPEYEALHKHEKEERDAEVSKPHLMATDSGRVVDVYTGRQVLHKTSSNTSLASKLQEQEEGELHKWGYFTQQSSLLTGDSVPTSRVPLGDNSDSSKITKESSSDSIDPNSSSTTHKSSASTNHPDIIQKPKILPKIPTGEELRKAIIEAKGIDSIDELIRKVRSNKEELEGIYDVALDLSTKSSVERTPTLPQN